MESHALCGTKSTTMAETAFASHIGPLREIGSPGGCFMIELEHRLGLKGLPTAKCTDHGLVLRPEPVSANATLTGACQQPNAPTTASCCDQNPSARMQP